MDRNVSINAARALVLGLSVCALAAIQPATASADSLVCRKVVSDTPSGEGRNTNEASRVKCAEGEMLTGGACYPEARPEGDGTCETSAMGVIQILADHQDTTEGAFFTCLQTGGSDCPVAARTRAMAICCKIAPGTPATAAKP